VSAAPLTTITATDKITVVSEMYFIVVIRERAIRGTDGYFAKASTTFIPLSSDI